MYSAVEIAQFIITFCTNIGAPVSNLQLQKILYYLQVHFAKNGKRLYEEDIYAWQYGPVIPEIYYLFSGYGACKIANRYQTNIEPDVQREIEPIIQRLIQISPWNLVEMTHEIGGPWYVAYNDGLGVNSIIDFENLVTDSANIYG